MASVDDGKNYLRTFFHHQSAHALIVNVNDCQLVQASASSSLSPSQYQLSIN